MLLWTRGPLSQQVSLDRTSQDKTGLDKTSPLGHLATLDKRPSVERSLGTGGPLSLEASLDSKSSQSRGLYGKEALSVRRLSIRGPSKLGLGGTSAQDALSVRRPSVDRNPLSQEASQSRGLYGPEALSRQEALPVKESSMDRRPSLVRRPSMSKGISGLEALSVRRSFWIGGPLSQEALSSL